MKKACLLLAVVWITACGHGNQDKEAVRKAVQDRLASVGMPPEVVGVELKSVDFKGDEATANVTVVPKGQPSTAGMEMKYALAYKDGKWAVAKRADSSASPHGGTLAPDVGDPHSGGAVPTGVAPGSGSKMPSPDDLPPAGKKK